MQDKEILQGLKKKIGRGFLSAYDDSYRLRFGTLYKTNVGGFERSAYVNIYPHYYGPDFDPIFNIEVEDAEDNRFVTQKQLSLFEFDLFNGFLNSLKDGTYDY